MPIVSEKGVDVSLGNNTGIMRNPRIENRGQKEKTRQGRKVMEDVNYLVVDVHTEGKESILPASWPPNISLSEEGKAQSALGRLLERFDMLPPLGETFTESVLDGLPCDYVVKPDGNFVRIDPESVRPSK